MRLFAAARLPEAAHEHLVHALRPFKADSERSLRWLDPDQWHLTCAFYGEVSGGELESIREHIAAAVALRPMTVSLRGAGSFSEQTLWIGVGGQTVALRSLMAACALEPTHERHRAHVTVARASRRGSGHRASKGRRDASPTPALVNPLPGLVRALSVYAGPRWQLDSIDLVQSELGRGRSGGPLHTVLDTFGLR